MDFRLKLTKLSLFPLVIGNNLMPNKRGKTITVPISFAFNCYYIY